MGTDPTKGPFYKGSALLARLPHRQKQVFQPCRQRHAHLRSGAKPNRLVNLNVILMFLDLKYGIMYCVERIYR